MTLALDLLGAGCVAAWGVMLFARGGFWLCRERDGGRPDRPPALWSSVTAVVPARNEADVIAASLGSLLAQDYPGPFRIILVDDDSADGTAAAARALDGGGRLEVIGGAPLPAGWTGKLWAQSQGVAAAGACDYLWLTDADIAHAPDTLSSLVARSQARGLELNSLMARLAVTTWAEALLIPAFVFFFAMLYPFAWVNDHRRATAAAAGGCMLVRREALDRAGGLAAIRSRIIDDCSLAALLKRQGPIWLGLTDRSLSLRPYGGFAEIGRMVARSAYAQLGFSPVVLGGCVAGMALVYLAAPVLAVLGPPVARVEGALAWLAMALAFQPMLAFYRRPAILGLLLPLIGAAYVGFTLASAAAHWRGRGGMWKGRAQAMAGVT